MGTDQNLLCRIEGWMTYGTGLSGNELLTLAVIQHNANKQNGLCTIPAEQIAWSIHVSHKTMTSCLSSLEKKGYIIRVASGKSGRQKDMAVCYRNFRMETSPKSYIEVWIWMPTLKFNNGLLSGNALILFAMICGYGQFFQGACGAAETLNTSERTIRYIEKDLVANGLINRVSNDIMFYYESAVQTEADYRTLSSIDFCQKWAKIPESVIFARYNSVFIYYIYRHSLLHNETINKPINYNLPLKREESLTATAYYPWSGMSPSQKLWLPRLNRFFKAYAVSLGKNHPWFFYDNLPGILDRMANAMPDVTDPEFDEYLEEYFSLGMKSNYFIEVFLSDGIQEVVRLRML